MLRSQTNIKHRWLVLCILTLASIVFTGCNNGNLGIKTGSISGYVIDDNTNQPISEVLVRATLETDNKSGYTDGDGSFCLVDVSKGSWKISVEKYGYVIATDSVEKLTCTVNNGETFVMSPIKMSRTTTNVKGTLKGYPIDEITGRAITNFTVNQVAPYNERKSKTFESASDFRDTGWTGLEGGAHDYTITAKNYVTWDSKTDHAEGVTIGKAATDLGTIKLSPLKVDISGTFSKVPGYAMNDNKNMVVWAESAGKVVASYTMLDNDTSKGTLTYKLEGIPVTAGTVSVKCKIKGYEPYVINSAVSIASANPGGVIAGVDCDFSSLEPITADLRVIVKGTKDEDENPSTFRTNEIARVYVQIGSTNAYTADVTSVNFGGEVTISGVITGYPIKVLAVNQNRKYCSGTSEEFVIPEESEVYPMILALEEG